jgi:hypothetical protein
MDPGFHRGDDKAGMTGIRGAFQSAKSEPLPRRSGRSLLLIRGLIPFTLILHGEFFGNIFSPVSLALV